jgi:hypothetical protein
MSQYKAYIFSINPLDAADGKWDYGLLKETFERHHIEQIVVKNIPSDERAFVVIPGQGNAGKEQIINKELLNINRVILFITGDESARFNIDLISHPNIEIWIQYPHKKHEKYNRFFIGVPQHLKQEKPDYPSKYYDIYFGGQVTHQRRKQLGEVMEGLSNALYKPTRGFAQGDTPKDYYKTLAGTKVAPAPAGAVVIDSFRFFEAIEMLCMPIGDGRNSKGEIDNYFNYIYPKELPFPVVDNWNEINHILPNLILNYPNNMHRVVCWWLKYKRDFGFKIMRQLHEQE